VGAREIPVKGLVVGGLRPGEGFGQYVKSYNLHFASVRIKNEMAVFFM
jgi:hypothetical protein